MRSALIVVVVLVGSSSIASADSSEWQTRETMGLDVTTLWEPKNRDAFGAGPLFRVEWHSTKLPDWLDLVTRWGVIVDSADRVFSPFTVGLLAKLGVPYLGAEFGGMLYRDELDDEMDDAMRLAWTAGLTGAVRVGNWDLRAQWMRGAIFDGNVWMFSLGRDFARLDSSVKRTTF